MAKEWSAKYFYCFIHRITSVKGGSRLIGLAACSFTLSKAFAKSYCTVIGDA